MKPRYGKFLCKLLKSNVEISRFFVTFSNIHFFKLKGTDSELPKTCFNFCERSLTGDFVETTTDLVESIFE